MFVNRKHVFPFYLAKFFLPTRRNRFLNVNETCWSYKLEVDFSM